MITAFNNFNELYLEMILAVKQFGRTCAPRGLQVKELLGQQWILLDPKNSLCTNRKLNYAFAVIEKFEYLSGESNPERICWYNSNFKNYLNKKTNQFDGAYGPRIKEQLKYCYELLLTDPDTRQAVITINDTRDRQNSLDVPCTVSLQFLLRDGLLNMIATMRSNDLLWGTPYDVNGFCFLQQAMASWLKVSLGLYYHQAGSLHYYLEREDQLTKITQFPITQKHNQSFPSLTYVETTEELKLFWQVEEKMRLHNDFDLINTCKFNDELNELKSFIVSRKEKLLIT